MSQHQFRAFLAARAACSFPLEMTLSNILAGSIDPEQVHLGKMHLNLKFEVDMNGFSAPRSPFTSVGRQIPSDSFSVV